jgi:hypothetical protein
MQLKKKLVLALAAYAVIAILAWRTLSEPRLRQLVWLVMGFFAFKSVLYWYRTSRARGGTNKSGASSSKFAAGTAPSGSKMETS